MGGEGGEDTRIDLLGVQPGEEESAFMERMFNGVVENAAELDKRIEENANGWKLERISRVDLAILRLAAYELMLGKTPENVVVNEAVEMARQYSGERSPQFVHGVLGGISRSMAR